MTLIHDIDNVRKAVLEFYQSDDVLRGLGGTSGGHLNTVVNAIKDPLPLNTEHTSAQVIATHYWPSFAGNIFSPFEDIKAAVDKVFDHLNWKTNKNYIGIFPDIFFENEAFVEMIGPNGLLLCDDCRIGFLILGEDTYYPSHHHEATELYHTISGVGRWQQGEGEEVIKPTGTPIYHEEWENHAMRTKEPLLNLWSWAGAISEEARVS